MDMLDKRLNDKGKNWRHVLKALKVLDYCLHEGSELVVTWAKQNLFVIKTLREFQYIDEDGRDVGQNGRFWWSTGVLEHLLTAANSPGGFKRAHIPPTGRGTAPGRAQRQKDVEVASDWTRRIRTATRGT